MRTLLMITALVLAVLSPSGAAFAAGNVPVPKGFVALCKTHPSECRGGGAAEVANSPQLQATLKKVNARVNAAIKPAGGEKGDTWTLNAKSGDCEDYVLAKRKALIGQGIPASALSIVYALNGAEGHAVLGVRTNEGVFVLDNLTGRIKPLDRTGYVVISMSGPNPMVWQRA